MDKAVALAERHEEQIARLAALEADWNSYGAKPVLSACLDRARPLIAALEELGLSPWLCPQTDGGVQIERYAPDDYCIEIHPDGTVGLSLDGLADSDALNIMRIWCANRAPTPTPETIHDPI